MDGNQKVNFGLNEHLLETKTTTLYSKVVVAFWSLGGRKSNNQRLLLFIKLIRLRGAG